MHFSSYKGRFQTAQTHPGDEDRKQVVLLCGATRADVYYELKQLFYNFVDYLEARDGMQINLHVLFPHKEAQMTDLQQDVWSYVRSESADALVIAHDGFSHYLGGEHVYNHINYVLPPKGGRRQQPSNPFGIPTTYTVPSRAWLQAGRDIKTEGAGVNLLGYVLNAIRWTARNENEVDISYLHNTDKYPVKPSIIRSIEQFDRLMAKLKSSRFVAVDSEGRNLNKLKNATYTLQFCTGSRGDKEQNLFVLPIEHRETPWSGKELKYIKREIRRWLENKSDNEMIIYHFGKYDLTAFINQFSVRWFKAPFYDTTAAIFTLDENTKYLKQVTGIKGYALETLEPRCGFNRPPDMVIGKEDRKDMARFSLKEVAEYGAYDVLTIWHIALRQCLAAKRRGYKGFKRLVTEQIGVMQQLFAFMEARGVLIDREHLMQLASPVGPLAERINAVKRKLYERKSVAKANRMLLRNRHGIKPGDGLYADRAEQFIFDIGNTESLQTLFFEVLNLEPLRQLKEGGGSVDKNFQKKYKDDCKEVALYAEYTKLVKLKSAFADGILKVMNESEDALEDGRLRASYWFVTVLTGRSSASDPNFQQIPSRGPDAVLIKLAFIAKKGGAIVKSDFSAHEIRVTGLVSGDKVIRKTFEIANKAVIDLRTAGDNYLEEARAAYKKDGDVHILNVRFFYNKEVDSEHPLRTDVKVTVFQTIYGSQAPSLGRQIGKTTEEAQALIDKLFETWPGAKRMMDQIVKDGSRQLYVFSPINRPRHLWAYLHPDKWVQYAMNRRGPNSIMQGLAADIVHQAAYCLEREIYYTFKRPGLNFDGQLLMMVHDSMSNEVSFKFVPVMMYLVEHAQTTLVMQRMKEAFDFDVKIPFGFDLAIGRSEGSMKKWKEMRYDGAEKILRETAKEDPSCREQLSDALYNLDAIWKVRLRELQDDPYRMRLQGKTEWYERHIRGMAA